MREVPEETWQEGRFSRREQDLGRAAGSATLGLRREVIPAGKQSFPAGTGVAHAFVADSGEELESLSIGERNDNDVVVYPDSGKLLVACGSFPP